MVWMTNTNSKHNLDNAFDAIADNPAQAAELKARAALMGALVAQIASWKLPPETAAARLKISKARLKELLGGKFGRFTLEALTQLTHRAEKLRLAKD
jgi:predicted XRE-type DNA-binding protein